jgi:hypothetical protein
MKTDWNDQAKAVCGACGGRCCIGACPPLSSERIAIILSRGDYRDSIEQNGYRRLKTNDDGSCSQLCEGRCRIHAFKPETCTAGPFTFAKTGQMLEIFLKWESVCPLVRFLKADRDMYAMQYRRAVDQLSHLVASLPSDELEIISRIPEPETDLVAVIPLAEVRSF